MTTRVRLLIGFLALSAGAAVVASPAACSSSGGGAAPDASAAADARAVPPTSDVQDSAATLPSLAAILKDDSMWSPVQGSGACQLFEGKVVPDPFPKRVWTSCGPGCSSSPGNLGVQEPTLMNLNVSAGFVDGDTYAFTSFDAGALGTVFRIERLSDGATVAAAIDRTAIANHACLQSWEGSAPFLFTLYKEGSGHLFARASKTPGAPIAWASSWNEEFPNQMIERFMVDDGYGVGGSGSLFFVNNTAPATATDLGGAAGSAHGLGAQAVWAGLTGVIRSYTAATGAVTLATMQNRWIPGIRLTDTRIVWFDSTPGDYVSDVHWRWSPRVDNPGAFAVHDGPAIPIVQLGFGFEAGGDWAVTTGCEVAYQVDTCFLYLWNVATNQTFRVPERPGYYFLRPLAISPTEVLLSEITQKELETNWYHVEELVRLDLTQLPALIQAWAH